MNNRSKILSVLKAHREEIMRRFAVRSLSLFGSAARDEMREDSDVDVLVEFDGPATFDGYMGLKDYLESLLGTTVDLVTRKGLKPRARRHVEQDLIHVA
ncbi:MAG: nucleotidyltransferase family protein [Zoogloeaceae bacterium]|nr:nucleotidyltransferase family protein [Zoogloeaceae bacterium]MCK6383525.1 nucleotidyltransferase family protein [Rhodocyclaceae bacterium]